ncbi:POK18 protein, partial [Ifrita kowaldi]|nr:POK18 protein [Ifrita kowaldi]
LHWKTNSPVWVDQWPLRKDKLQALHALVQEQLEKGNIVPTNSPWNSPVFVIKKPGRDKWWILHDLRKINNVIEDMGPLQPGMPSPAMLPQGWKIAIAVLDIKDCFFQIPLHPEDAPWFAFSVPSINREAPMRRYHWRVLPQGMKNSPTICQWYVAKVLSPIQAEEEQAVILHYMDDVLVCCPDDKQLERVLTKVTKALEAHGFELQADKIQRTSPWKYLGLRITETTVVPQPVQIKTNPRTLQELQQLCGSLNWVRPWLGLTNGDLAPLFNLLRGQSDLLSPRSLTPEARESIRKAEKALSEKQANRYRPQLPFRFII